MEQSPPSLRQQTRKRYVSDNDGRVRFVESVETSQTYIDEFRTVDENVTDVLWMCAVCAGAVASFTHIQGEITGIGCGCALRRAKKIISDEFWNPGSCDTQTLQKAYMIRDIFRRTRWRRAFASLSNFFERE